MSVIITSPITGAAQTGLTSPTYTVVNDTPPVNVIGIQRTVSALGGTQTGVDVHSISRPFTCSVIRPSVYKALGVPNPVTGVVSTVPSNVTKVITRKGVTPLAGQPSKAAVIKTELAIPAGSDVADPANIRAAISLHIGLLSQISAALGDATITGSV